MEKQGFLHGHRNMTTSTSKIYAWHLNDSVWRLVPKTRTTIITPELEVRSIDRSNETINYIILTGNDNLTMFVFASDYNAFTKKYKKDVIKKLNEYDYSTYYKSPLLSYGSGCNL